MTDLAEKIIRQIEVSIEKSQLICFDVFKVSYTVFFPRQVLLWRHQFKQGQVHER